MTVIIAILMILGVLLTLFGGLFLIGWFVYADPHDETDSVIFFICLACVVAGYRILTYTA